MVNIFAKASGLNPGFMSWTGVDCHLYLNHLEVAKEQILREPLPFPTLRIEKELNTIEDVENLTFSDFKLNDYQYHPKLKAEMAV